jgi:uncharacterized protein (TIGR02598 family)
VIQQRHFLYARLSEKPNSAHSPKKDQWNSCVDFSRKISIYIIPRPSPPQMNQQKSPLIPFGKLRGFSLIEVCIAIGIVSFSLLALVALVPNGLKTLGDAATESSLSAIRKEARSELNTANLQDLINMSAWHFDQTGRRLPDTTPATERFFQLSFAAADPVITGQATGFGNSVKQVTLRVTYPVFAPAASQVTNIFTLLVARQSSQ